MRNNSRKNRGFTLIELMVVILILAILAALIVPKLIGHSDQAKVAKAAADVKTISDSLERFRIDTGRYPTDSEGLQPLIQAPSDVSGWNGPYIATLPLDPWNDPYTYHFIDDRTVEVRSYGPDRSPNTADDITNNDNGPATGQ